MVPINHVGPTLAKRDLEKEWLAYAGLIGLRAFDQHGNKKWQLSRPYEQNDIRIASFVDVGPTKLLTKCQRWPNKRLLSWKTHVGNKCL